MDIRNKATRIDLLDFRSPQMRAFHMTWFAFFLCFFAWFGIAPLMAVVREELGLTKEQIGNTIIASVAITIVARLLVGWLCDRFGPRLTYSGLLLVASIPVMGIGLAQDYTSFLLFRLGIGVIGASFVITQYHTTLMFAPNVVGTANATTAGWGNLGGGVTQLLMPAIFSGFLAVGLTSYWSWRASMLVAGVVCLLTGIAYFFLTQDTPEGNYRELRARGKLEHGHRAKHRYLEACKDYRVWVLFLIYGACFGVELTLNNIAALYFMDYFGLSLAAAGGVAACFGLMNLFARTLGGVFGDRFGKRFGLRGRVRWMTIALAGEAIALIWFSQMTWLPAALAAMVVFSLFVQMSEGATYSVVPFINKNALGPVAGIVGAGGNLGAVAAGFLFKTEALSWPQALLILGLTVGVGAVMTLAVRFSEADEHDARRDMEARLAAAGGELPEAAAA